MNYSQTVAAIHATNRILLKLVITTVVAVVAASTIAFATLGVPKRAVPATGRSDTHVLPKHQTAPADPPRERSGGQQ